MCALRQIDAHIHILYYTTLQAILQLMTSSTLTLNQWQSSVMEQQTMSRPRKNHTAFNLIKLIFLPRQGKANAPKE